MKSLYGGTLLSMYVNMGYAVVAPDYVGLGTPSRNAALDARSNATDLIYSVKAAQRSVSQLGEKWIAAGELDGGLAALLSDEIDSEIGDPGYLGSIAINPTLGLRGELESLRQHGQDALAFLAYGLKTLYPEFRPQQLLSARSMVHYQEVAERCSLSDAPGSGLGTETLPPYWDTNLYVDKFLNRNALGSARARRPMLIIAPVRPAANFGKAQVINRMCKQGDQIDLQSFDAPADDLTGESASYQTSWLQARFSGVAAPGICHK